jgi:hypothetical protein
MVLVYGSTFIGDVYVLIKMGRSETQQPFMIGVIALMCASCFCMLIVWLPNAILSYTKGLTFILSKQNVPLTSFFVWMINFGYLTFDIGFWLICFKYWQTAYELSFLFMMRDERRAKQHFRIFAAMNGVVIGLELLGFFLSAFGVLMKSKGLIGSGYCIQFGAELMIILVFADAIYRMNNAISQLPILKRSERVFWFMLITFLFYLADLIFAIIVSF